MIVELSSSIAFFVEVQLSVDPTPFLINADLEVALFGVCRDGLDARWIPAIAIECVGGACNVLSLRA